MDYSGGQNAAPDRLRVRSFAVQRIAVVNEEIQHSWRVQARCCGLYRLGQGREAGKSAVVRSRR
jgi:hypothetical protein